MSKKVIYIIAGIVLLYSIIISILLVLLGNRLKASELSTVDHEKNIAILKERVSRDLNIISSLQTSFDAITPRLERIDKSISEIGAQRVLVVKKYRADVADLPNKSIDSLKIIALSNE